MCQDFQSQFRQHLRSGPTQSNGASVHNTTHHAEKVTYPKYLQSNPSPPPPHLQTNSSPTPLLESPCPLTNPQPTPLITSSRSSPCPHRAMDGQRGRTHGCVRRVDSPPPIGINSPVPTLDLQHKRCRSSTTQNPIRNS